VSHFGRDVPALQSHHGKQAFLALGWFVGASFNGGISMDQHSKEFCIFVVDDEFVISSTLALILRQKGFFALAFQAPLDALEAARYQVPDLLISDVVMPQLSGIELAIRIQEQCPDCKVLLFSGQAATVGLLLTANVRGHHFEVMSKPVHPTDLLRRIAGVTAVIRVVA
jgi:DNA-binding NtrC family response regulator